MPFSDTVRVIQTGSRRTKIFVDFWNVVISARKQTQKLEIEVNWNILASEMVNETHQDYSDETRGTLAGCYIFGSYTKSDPKQMAFVNQTLDNYGSLPGLFFTFTERVKKETSVKCSKCGHLNAQETESGVDVILAVEMIKHAAMREHEYLALVSSDRDFIPLLSYLKDQGQRVLHAATEEPNREMRSLTWKQVELKPNYINLCSIISGDKYYVFTAPKLDTLTNEATIALEEQGAPYEIFDLTGTRAMQDKDLRFLLSNQRIFFRKKYAANTNATFSYQTLYKSIDEFRAALKIGDLVGHLPYVMHSGSLYVRSDPTYRWVVSSNTERMEPWRKLQTQPSRT
jgi:uncharacterized LabA/DUF88 family protein